MQKKILVVDDEPHIVKAIRYYLEDENYEVITAEEGEAPSSWPRTSSPT